MVIAQTSAKNIDITDKTVIEQFLKTLTQAPGVYQMLDHTGKILYVGKAKNLKKRVSSYFRTQVDHPKTAMLVRRIADIKIIITQDENEALLLENNLIKQHRPHYNILFKDDKSYPYLVFSKDDYPRLDLFRSHKTPPGEYFGPFSNVPAVRQTLQLIEKLFLLRNCSNHFFAQRSRPCLQYDIKRCSAPCVGLINQHDYGQALTHAKLFLQGKSQAIIQLFHQKMDAAAARLDFEQAAVFRDQIQQLRQVETQQSIQNAQGEFDVIGAYTQEDTISVQLLMIRQGKVIGDVNFFYENTLDVSVDDALNYFIAQYYCATDRFIPKQIVVRHRLQEQKWLSHALQKQAQHAVLIKVAQRGVPLNLIKMAEHNACEALRAHLAHKSAQHKRCADLAEVLQVPLSQMNRIECFDISHTSGEKTVASCVVFDQNGPNKKEYRIFNINDVAAGDDFAAMHQVLMRRYSRVKNSDAPLPDIIVIDGGKIQLQQAIDVLSELKISNIILLGIAKGATRKAGFETIWRAGSQTPLAIDPHAPALHLLQHIRDEAHRFAITRHRQKRSKTTTQSTLETIPGIGHKKRQALLKHFGGMQGLKNASLSALAKVPGISLALAEKIYQYR